jgi:hypothetical protein
VIIAMLIGIIATLVAAYPLLARLEEFHLQKHYEFAEVQVRVGSIY